MYKIASDRRQTALHRGRVVDWVNGQPDPPRSPEQQLRDLQDEIKILECRILTQPAGDKRKALGIQKLAVQGQIKEIRAAQKIQRIAKQNLEQWFVNAARELLTKGQFDLIMARANRDWTLAQQAYEPHAPEQAP